MNKRIALKQFRIGLQLTQQEMADKLNVERGKYVGIENGLRNGKYDFWENFQRTFNIPDEKMWEFQKLGGVGNAWAKNQSS